ncbi:MAG: hypothetical protein ACKVU4_08175 [Phycisphaerales bacterium]
MLKHVIVVGVVTCAAGVADARPEIPYANLPASATTINFDTMAGTPVLGTGEVLGGQYAGSGVTFTVPNYNAYATNGAIATGSLLNTDPNVIWINQGGGTGGALAVGINLNFSAPVHRVGAWMGGSSGSTFSIAAYNGTTLLETITHALTPGGIGQEGFMAIERSETITRAVMFSTNAVGQNWNFSIDDVKFEGGATCYADCNASGNLTVADFGCFQGKYVLGDLYADCNASGSLTVADFGCFQGKYVLGCP